MKKKQETFVVIGGGAAGFFAAVNAASCNPDLRVILLEKTTKLLSKVAISGGGRCNVTHACFDNAQLVKHYPRGAKFLRKAFEHFSTTDTVSWFEGKGVSLKTEPDGRMFPVSDNSQSIVHALLGAANALRVEILMNAAVTGVSLNTDDQRNDFRFEIQLKNQANITADYLCIACGGLSQTAHGAWIRDIGHHVIEPAPSLFTFNLTDKNITALMGVTVQDVQVRIAQSKLRQRGPMLITHWGFSGPAILKLSAWGAVELAELNYDFNGFVNWVPTFDESSLHQEIKTYRAQLAASKMANKNPFGLPSRLWEFLLHASDIDAAIRWADLPAKNQNVLVKQLCSFEFHVKGKTTFKEEFVTAGGVDLAEVDPNTMESRIVKGLYFAGEVLNVDGVTGGFNFQHAWTSGWIAARDVSAKASQQMEID